MTVLTDWEDRLVWRRVIGCGSRRWHDRDAVAYTLADVAAELGTTRLTIVVGDARGADRLIEEEAQKHGFLVERHRAEWGSYGKRAGLIRNDEMARSGAELCVAFWDGRSTGTAHMIEAARAEGIPVWIVEPEGGIRRDDDDAT